MAAADPAAPSGHPAERSLAERAVVLYDADCGVCVWLLTIMLRCDRAGRLRWGGL
jgi:predicted DCC family thiol-disulfide oxidoreductase YuxK